MSLWKFKYNVNVKYEHLEGGCFDTSTHMLSKSEQECFQHWLLFWPFTFSFAFHCAVFYSVLFFLGGGGQIQQFCNLFLNVFFFFFCSFLFVLKCSEKKMLYLFSHIFQFSWEYIQNTMCCWHGKLHSWLFPQLQISFVDQHGRNHSCSLNIPAAGCKETMWMNTLLLRFRLSQVIKTTLKLHFLFFRRLMFLWNPVTRV